MPKNTIPSTNTPAGNSTDMTRPSWTRSTKTPVSRDLLNTAW